MTDMNIENRKLNRPASENDKQHKKVFPIEAEAFHSPEETLARLNSHRQGLTIEEASERLKVYGRNEVAHEQVPPVLVQLLQAFNNPFIYVLMALAGVSFITDYWLPLRRGEETDLTGVLIILTMVSLSGLLRFWQEFRTNRAAQALKKMVRTTATVLRRGPGNIGAVQEEIPIEELVPGDVVFLAAGDLVPADVRLLASRDLFISQSILSGESLPVEKYDVMADVAGKDSEQLPDKDKSLLDLGNICLMGTNVTSGRAQAVVVATGSRTWFGSLAKSIVGTRTQTAFDRGVNSVSWLLIRFMLIMVPVVLLINGFSKGDWVEASLFALAVAVGLTPLQKTRILQALQKNGHTVGFLGDGINDAPALRDADVGISVDSAADIAKESSDIILLEKDLMVLEEGVIKGRETFGNIIKYLNMTASSNFGNVFSVLVASAFIPFLPMLAIHLLIQNLMYDISQLSLPWDKMDKEFLRKPRKWDAKNIGRFMLWIGPTSSIFDITTFALMWYVFAANNVEAQALFQSGWFIEGLLSQTLVVHMLRTQKIPFIQSRATLPVLLTTGLIMAIGIYIPFSPLGAMVGLEPLPLSYFPWLVATLLSYCLVAQGMKRFYIKRFGQWF
ncbi:HAD-IC family P-type ATPase [Salmonella enterica]|nr:HAD-IC family P-type ATPase [Salmonella enterica]